MLKSINVFHIIWNWFSVIIVGLKVDGKVFFKSIKFTPSANFNNATAEKLTIKESNFFHRKRFLIQRAISLVNYFKFNP